MPRTWCPSTSWPGRGPPIRRAWWLLAPVAAGALLLLQGCSIQSLALRTVDGMFDKTVSALMQEGDLKFAEAAMAGDLKLLEGVTESDPSNVRYLELACMGYASYALAFASDEPSRALTFYSRAKSYGVRGMMERGVPRAAFGGDAAGMKAALRHLGRGDVPLVFWTANAWGNAISLQPDDPDVIASIPAANALMEWVQGQDPGYFYGGPSLYFGVYYGSYPPSLGGRPDLSRRSFEQARAAAHGRFLMTDVLYARTYAVQTQDRPLFHELLTQVVEAPADLLPEQRLANAVAQRRAKELLAHEEELF